MPRSKCLSAPASIKWSDCGFLNKRTAATIHAAGSLVETIGALR
jgi:hypothetical protein